MSAQITADTVAPILAGDEDFAGAADALQQAIDLDPNNNAAKFFQALFNDFNSQQFMTQQSGGAVNFVHTPGTGIEASFTPTQSDQWAYISTLVDNINSESIAAVGLID